jgi:uncharacterized protein (TIRG00374 family)
MRGLLWRVLRYVLPLGVVGYAVYSQRGELASAVHQLAGIRWPWFLLAAFAEYGSFAYQARMQRRLLSAGGTRVTRRTSMALIYAQSALSQSFPGGPVLSNSYAFRQYRLRGADQALSAWVLVVGAIASNAAIVVLAVVGAELSGVGGVGVTVLVSVVLGSVLVGLSLLFRRRRGAEAIAGRVLRWLKRHFGRPKGDPDALVAEASHQLGGIHPSRVDFALVAMSAVLIWATDLFCLTTSYRALGAHAPWPGVIVAYTVGQLASSVPFLPGGLGLVEGGIAATLIAYGTSRPIALGVVLIYRLLSFWAVIAIGWAMWLALRSKRDLTVEATTTGVDRSE